MYTNGIEGFWTLIKRGYMGVYHYMSRKHMPRYAVEFTERNNARVDGMTTLDVLRQIMTRTEGRTVTAKQLRNSRVRTEEDIFQEVWNSRNPPPNPHRRSNSVANSALKTGPLLSPAG